LPGAAVSSSVSLSPQQSSPSSLSFLKHSCPTRKINLNVSSPHTFHQQRHGSSLHRNRSRNLRTLSINILHPALLPIYTRRLGAQSSSSSSRSYNRCNRLLHRWFRCHRSDRIPYTLVHFWRNDSHHWFLSTLHNHTRHIQRCSLRLSHHYRCRTRRIRTNGICHRPSNFTEN